MTMSEQRRTAVNGPSAPRNPYDRPPLEERAPDVGVRHGEPLFPHETLEGWRHPDGEWHWRYRARVDAHPVTVRLTAEPGVPVEEVAERVRAVAALGTVG